VVRLEQAHPTEEVALLQKLKGAGLRVAQTWVTDQESTFYELGNLASQIEALFVGVFGARVDENKLVQACHKAEQLLRESYMLPEYSDQIKAALPTGKLLVRYASEAPFAVEDTPQQALWAIKRLWSSRWQIDQVLDRQPNLAPPSSGTLVQQSTWPNPDPALSEKASRICKKPLQVWVAEGAIVRASEL
jgi:hypothetical protein